MKKRHKTIEDKLKRLSKLDPDKGCLIWTGARGGRGGYGIIWTGKGNRYAHIVAWECINGPCPKGFIIRRTCGEELCVNVHHMALFKFSITEDDTECQLDHLKRKIIVNLITGCWEWQGAKKSGGYGRLYVGGRYVSAHRLMWKCIYGKTKGLHVLHKCDNPSCVRPDHLFLGTHTDNMQDRTIKNRAGVKLNAEAVRDIRTSKISSKELAEKYEVSVTTISYVLNYKTWKHVE